VTVHAGRPPAARLLQLTRAGYGVALVMAPGLVTYLATGRFPGRRGRRVAQVLGARHLIQAAVTAFVPVPDVFALGAGADAAHAATMVMLAAGDRAARPAALTDALAEAAFAAAGWGRARAARGGAENTALSCGPAAGTRPPAAATGARRPPGSPPGHR
jgi:hypothetical protein